MSNQTPPAKKWVRVKEVAARYSVTDRAVYAWKAEGKIPFLQIGKTLRFDMEAVIEALEGKGDPSK